MSHLCAPVNRLWAPPQRYRRFFMLITIALTTAFLLESIHYLIIVRPCGPGPSYHRFIRRRPWPIGFRLHCRTLSSQHYFKSQEARNPIAYRHPVNRNPIVNDIRPSPLHFLHTPLLSVRRYLSSQTSATCPHSSRLCRRDTLLLIASGFTSIHPRKSASSQPVALGQP